jgi:cell division protein FtsW (lipid II flippase)
MTATTASAAGTASADRVPTRRGVELLLLVGAVLVPVTGYAAVGLGKDGAVPPDVTGYAVGLTVLSLLAHLAVRFCAPYADPLLLPIAVLLNGLGLVLIYRLDLETTGQRAATAQLVWSAVGIALFVVVVVFLHDHRALQRYAYVSVAAALVLMVVPIMFPAVNGAKIWVRIGDLSFQPGEFAKVLLAVFFASYLATNHRALATAGRRALRLRLPSGRVLGPILAIWLLSVAVLVLERDLGTSLLFFGLFVIMLYVSTGRTGWIAIGLLLAAVGAFAVGSLEPHVHSRVEDWLHPFATIDAGLGPGQLAQSLFAFAAGGVLGTGLGLGHSVLIGFAAKSDFILATAGEELGLVGLTALFLLYALLVSSGLRAGLAARDAFGRLLAVGLASTLAFQVFVIAGGVTGLIPLTGMAMPFLAQGGSSVVTNWVMVALLVRISDSGRRPRGSRSEAEPLDTPSSHGSQEGGSGASRAPATEPEPPSAPAARTAPADRQAARTAPAERPSAKTLSPEGGK